MRMLAVCYGVVSYLFFFLVFLYAIGFVAGEIVPKSIDSGLIVSPVVAAFVDGLLLSLFAVQHSLMARPAFKRWWVRFVPPPIERSTYVLFSSLALALLFWLWRPLPHTLWSVTTPALILVIWTIFWIGWATVLSSTFLINHFDLFGLRQVWAYRSRRELPPSNFQTPLFYRLVRHPLYLGFILAFWAAPRMTVGRLTFALATTLYILGAIQLEEHDLISVFGERYEDYRRRVSMLLPIPRRRPAAPHIAKDPSV